uniref:Thymopoietin b n=1 Tax=Poecilia formosa TaxID=48698 RepID=A0A087X8B1_POEFO
MAEFLEDPSVLTKDKLKNELTAHNVPLPSGDQKKEVYVQLYLKNLTIQNNKKSPPLDTFSSDEELPTPVVSNRSRSGRKATKKTDKPRTEEVEVTELTDEDLKQQLAKHGVDTGPIVASTRKVYEKKLQKLLDEHAAEPAAPTDVTTLPKADSNQNGNTNSDHYSDKEDEEIVPPEPEPVPVVEKPVRSRGKAPVTVRTSSRRQTKVVEEVITEETPKKASKSVVEDILANEINTPTGISCSASVLFIQRRLKTLHQFNHTCVPVHPSCETVQQDKHVATIACVVFDFIAVSHAEHVATAETTLIGRKMQQNQNLAEYDREFKKTEQIHKRNPLKQSISVSINQCIYFGCSATCRRPIRGAAGRPLKPSEYWLDESRVQRTVHTESRSYTETYSQPISSASSSKAPPRRGFFSLLIKLLLLVVVVGSLYYAYQNLSSVMFGQQKDKVLIGTTDFLLPDSDF